MRKTPYREGGVGCGEWSLVRSTDPTDQCIAVGFAMQNSHDRPAPGCVGPIGYDAPRCCALLDEQAFLKGKNHSLLEKTGS
jgi:hypothetical protein